jgi:2-dehydro-3-deoxyphosphogluconate aldolase/(4S)-4-hydroxy-2-oxoglutarate aldolase
LTSIRQQIIDAKAITIIRGDYHQHLDTIARALLAHGVKAMEVTLNSPGALEMIAYLATNYGDRMLIGAGTVLDATGVAAAASAGARFIVSPDTFPETIQSALTHGIEPIPGVLTPTEARTAMRAGAVLLKLFPATLGGTDYLKQLCAPLNEACFIPTGGISAENAADYLHAGAVALGVGSWLVPPKFDGSVQAIATIEQRAAALMQAIRTV